MIKTLSIIVLVACGISCSRQQAGKVAGEDPMPMPDAPFVKSLCPNGFEDGLHELTPAWTGRVDVVCDQGVAGLVETNHTGVNLLFDRIVVQTNRPQRGWYHGPVWVVQSAGSNSYSNVHVYRNTFPLDAEIQACPTASALRDLLGESFAFRDGYGDNWSLFRMNREDRMEILEISAFWMCGEDVVQHLKIARGLATPQGEDAEPTHAGDGSPRAR
jgi:hypothetical protein